MNEFVHPEQLSIFQKPLENRGVSKIQHVIYRPVAAPSGNSIIEFNIPSSGALYLDLRNTEIHARVQITKPDGNPIDDTDSVGFVAMPLHGLFAQIDILLQQDIVSSCTNYPHRAYIHKLLNTSTQRAYPQNEKELFILDGNTSIDKTNQMDQADPNAENGRNGGLNTRAKYTSLGRILDLQGPLLCDVCDQDKYILNGVDLRIRLSPTTDAFRLMTDSDINYQVKIVDIYLSVCKVTVSPEVILAHGTILEASPAVYPFYKSIFKTFTAQRGQYSHAIEAPYGSKVPSKLYVFFTDATSFNGDYKRNPFNLKHNDVRSAAFYINGVSAPVGPIQTRFSVREVVEAYTALLQTAGKSDYGEPFDVNLKRFMDGTTILAFNITSAHTSPNYLSQVAEAHCRLEFRFGVPLVENINICLYALFPEILTIDHARNVSLSAPQ